MNQDTSSQKSEIGTSVLQVLGGLLFLIGVLLMFGNLSGYFVTFPFAGFSARMGSNSRKFLYNRSFYQPDKSFDFRRVRYTVSLHPNPTGTMRDLPIIEADFEGM